MERTERANVGLMVGGILLSVAGGLGVLVGTAAVLGGLGEHSCPYPDYAETCACGLDDGFDREDCEQVGAGLVAVPVGAAMLVPGIVMARIGGRKVRVRSESEQARAPVRIVPALAPNGARLAVQF